MHFPNPFTNAPRLPSPSKRRAHSRSPSHSPVRFRARDHDPLLRDLSPSSTLRAFVADPNEWTESTSNALARSILTSSNFERALGAKAAQICLDVRSWTREMEHWQWPGTFETPRPAQRSTRTSTLSHGTTLSITPDEEEEYSGSLPAKLVSAYGVRADEIGQALDRVDVEEMKDFVLSAHCRTDSRPAERGRRSDLKQLDDYTAVITATILQTLPYLSRLSRLLDVWTIRLIILQAATAFIRDLHRARMDLDRAWAAITVSAASTTLPTSTSIDRKTMLETKDLIESQVGSLGRRLDRFLDDLEGREETVPEAWIEDFERLESAYGDWVVQAERRVLENEWHEIREKTTMTRAGEPYAISGALGDGSAGISHTEDPDSDGEAVIKPSVHEMIESAKQESRGRQEGVSSPDGHLQEPDSHDLGGGWRADNLLPRKSLSDERKSRNVSAGASSLRTPSLVATPDTFDGSEVKSAPTDSPDPDGDPQLPKARAAFLRAIERSSTLKQSKSPVRPFEHASNAFTRLFKKDRSPEHVKSGAEVTKPDSGSRSGERTNLLGRRSRSPGPQIQNQTSTASAGGLTSNASDRVLVGSIGSTRARSQPGSPSHNSEPQPAPLLMPPKDIQRRKSASMKSLDKAGKTAELLSSPFHTTKDANVPENWPLSTPVQTPSNDPDIDPIFLTTRAESEIYTPAMPLATDTFDQMFVQNFPTPALARPRSARETRERTKWIGGHMRAKSMPRIKGKSSVSGPKHPEPGDTKDMHSNDQATAFDNSPSIAPVVPLPISLAPEQGNVPRAESQVSSLDDDDDAVDVEDLPTQEPSPLSNGISVIEVEGASTSLIELPVESSSFDGADGLDASENAAGEETAVDDSNSEKPQFVKRASITSIEAFKRADVKSIDVLTPSKTAIRTPGSSPPQTPHTSRPQSPIDQLGEDTPSTPLSQREVMTVLTPPRGSSIGKTSSSARPMTPSSRRRSTLSPSPLGELPERSSASTPEGRRAPLNAAMTKRRGKAAQRDGGQATRLLTLSPSKKGAYFNPEGDSFDRHISEVLETLPSSIRFRTRPGAETPVLGLGEPRASGAPRARTSRALPRPNVTIAPAESPPKRSGSSDNEVKVYHLTQAGSDETIKLFVRLVGESERVMVRVGGGWADLADYLRQYAEHHGSRTVSEGTLEVQSVNGTASRRVSGAAESKGKQPAHPVTNRSTPPDDAEHGGGGEGGGSNNNPDDPNSSGEPQPRFSMGDSTSSDEGVAEAAAPAPSIPTGSRHTPSTTSTPISASKVAAAAAAATPTSIERPLSRQSVSDVKLSGPSSAKRGQLSEHKEKWVEGMIERAKQATTTGSSGSGGSAEKPRDDGQKYFGELGTAGGTRRVIFRASSAMSNRANGSDNKTK